MQVIRITGFILGLLCLAAAGRVLWGVAAQSLPSQLGAGLLALGLGLLAVGHFRRSLVAAKASAALGGVLLLLLVPPMLGLYREFDAPGTLRAPGSGAGGLLVLFAALAIVHYALSVRGSFIRPAHTSDQG